jgi:hypothetical protein
MAFLPGRSADADVIAARRQERYAKAGSRMRLKRYNLPRFTPAERPVRQETPKR